VKRLGTGRVILTGTEARGIAMLLVRYQGFLQEAIHAELVCGEEPKERKERKRLAAYRVRHQQAERFRKGLVGE